MTSLEKVYLGQEVTMKSVIKASFRSTSIGSGYCHELGLQQVSRCESSPYTRQADIDPSYFTGEYTNFMLQRSESIFICSLGKVQVFVEISNCYEHTNQFRPEPAGLLHRHFNHFTPFD